MARQLPHFSRAKIVVTESCIHYRKRQHPESPPTPLFLPRREDCPIEVMNLTLTPTVPGGPAPFPRGVQQTLPLQPSHRPPKTHSSSTRRRGLHAPPASLGQPPSPQRSSLEPIVVSSRTTSRRGNRTTSNPASVLRETLLFFACLFFFFPE